MSDCQHTGHTGTSKGIEIAPSIEGDSLARMVQYIDRLSAAPVRGLIRRDAIRQAGLVRSDEFRAPLEVFVWLAKLLRWGNFKRVAQPLYYRLDHPNSFTSEYLRSPQDRMKAVRTALFTGLFEAAMPLCRTPAERLFCQQFILDQIVLSRLGNESNSSRKFIADCLQRLRYEGNVYLLGEDLPTVLQKLQGRQDQIDLLERSRMRRVIYRMRKRSRIARLIYPRSRIRRVIYQIRHLLEILKYKMKLLPG
jgi:hypothetical protein